MVGVGEDEEKANALIQEYHLENVIKKYPMQTQKELALFYSAIDIFCFPTYRKSDSLGLVGLEAMACGTPVITSNVTSLPELFYNSALLVNPYDVYALSYAMEKVLCDSLLKLTMVQKGLITSSNYTWQKTAKNTISAYEKIINSK